MKKQNRKSKQTTVAVDDSSPPKRVHDLELENNAYKSQIEELRYKLANVTSTSDDGVQELKGEYFQKLNALEEQVVELKKKLNAKPQLSTQKYKNDETAKQDENQRLKTQKVQLQCKIKLDSMQFRLCKAALEKEVYQLKKEQRRNVYEMHKLSALNRMQKLVMQRKTKEASVATKRLQELLESRKALSRRTAVGGRRGSNPGIQDNQRELDVTVLVQEVCSEYEHQIEEMFDEVNNLKLEAEMLEEENSRCLLQDKEADCRVKDSELRDLKEEVARLSSLVSQMKMPKPQLIHRAKSQVDMVQVSVSVESVDLFAMDASQSEQSVGIVGAMGRPASGVCCSCSKKSLCKTTKCGCRAGGGSCGTSCGCSASKCANREVLIKLYDSLQSEMAENVMNSQGEVLLQNALDEKPAEMIGNQGPRKMPLCDIGNSLVNSNAVRPGQKKRGRKPVIQHGTVDPPSSLPESTGGPKKADKSAMQAYVPNKLPRATRSTVSKITP